MRHRRWHIRPHDPEQVSALCRALPCPPLVAMILAARGWHDLAAARRFLDVRLNQLYEPSLLPGAEEAAQRILRAVQKRRRIVIYGDYDADGVCGTSILWQALHLAGADVGYYIPNRLEEGYGLNAEALGRLAERGAGMVVTVDCGIASVAEAQTARELGLELIVTDHHEFGPELPKADVLVHPRLPGSQYPFPELSGSGVALKLAWAIGQQLSDARRVSPAMRGFLLGAIALAALGTVADVVPLVDENRVLVRYGLRSLHSHDNVGLKALLHSAALGKKRMLAAEDIGYMLAPRINAVGRLGQAKLAVELLTTTSAERARQLADHLNQQNALRQQVERRIAQQARQQAEELLDGDSPPALVLTHADWHAGVIGIVAGRLAERYHRPAILLALQRPLLQGSGRSVPGFHLHRALHACRDCLESYGGHAAAAGLKLQPHRLDEFRDRFCQEAKTGIEPKNQQHDLTIDAETPLHFLTKEAVQQLESMAPFGSGNPRPVLAAAGVQLAAPPRPVGSGRHLALRLAQNGVVLRGIAFGQGEHAEELAPLWNDGAQPRPFDIAFAPVLNAFAGSVGVELHIKDWHLRND